MKALLIAFDGFEDIELLATRDILIRSGFRCFTASFKEDIISRCNLNIKANLLIKDVKAKNYDLIFIPGGKILDLDPKYHEKIKELVLEFKKEDKYITAICAAPYVLSLTNLLEDNKYTCYPGVDIIIKKQRLDQNVVVNGKIITGRAPGAVFDFALKIVEILKGKEIYEKVKKEMVI